MLTKEEKSKIGKRSKNAGQRFEVLVRKDLEEKGFIVSKWMNNVNLEENKLIQVKNKFRGKGIPMMLGAGMPDFITMQRLKCSYKVIAVESKMRGKLDKTEKEKCSWLLKNNIFSKILIASKKKVGRKVVVQYKEFKC